MKVRARDGRAEEKKNTTMKTKREYWQPAMTVVELQVRNQLLAGSTEADKNNYGDGGEEDW